jgi:hypothetical protein
MRQLAQRCPQCGVTWLVFGAPQLESYTCKSCSKRFTIRANSDEANAETSDATNYQQPDQAA